MKKITRIFRHLVFSAVLLAPMLANAADGVEKPWNRFSLSLGGFSTALNSTTVLGLKDLGAGVDVNTEEAFGLDKSVTAFRIDANWRFTKNRRHMLDFTYLDLSRSGDKVLEQDIPIFDETLTVGTYVQSKFDLQIFKFGYSYSFFQDDRFDLGGNIGLFVMPISIELSADETGNEAADVTAPLPALGLRFDFAITPKLFLRQNYDFFYLSNGDFQGAIVNSKVVLDYNFWKHVGLGIGLENFRMRVKSKGSGDYPTVDLFGKVDFRYMGVLFYIRTYF